MTFRILSKKKQFEKLPSAILFDMDDTLYPYEPAHGKALELTKQKASQLLGINAQQFDEIYARAREEIKNRLGKTASSHSRLLYFQRMIEIFGMRSQPLMALDLEQVYWRSFLIHTELFPGVQECLAKLRVLGIPTAIVTDLTAQIQFRKIIYFGLEDCFDYIITSEEAGKDKPDALPFLLAIEKLKVSDSRQVWMIGEHPLSDMAGAKKALGAITLQKKHADVRVLNEHVDAVFENYFDLLKIFEHYEKSEFCFTTVS